MALCAIFAHNGAMPNIASVLKSEISRVARKEVRAETASLKKAVDTYRSEIAALKRRAQALESELKRLGQERLEATRQPGPKQSDATKLRFSAKGFAAQRKRLGLSAHEVGLLVETSSQSIYNWESGTTRPRATYLPAIARLRSMGKKEAAASLKALQGGLPRSDPCTP